MHAYARWRMCVHFVVCRRPSLICGCLTLAGLPLLQVICCPNSHLSPGSASNHWQRHLLAGCLRPRQHSLPPVFIHCPCALRPMFACLRRRCASLAAPVDEQCQHILTATAALVCRYFLISIACRPAFHSRCACAPPLLFAYAGDVLPQQPPVPHQGCHSQQQDTETHPLTGGHRHHHGRLRGVAL
jgi:hypothetical protein